MSAATMGNPWSAGSLLAEQASWDRTTAAGSAAAISASFDAVGAETDFASPRRRTVHARTSAVGCRNSSGAIPSLKPPLAFSAHSACSCLLYTSDAADERSSVDLGGRR